ncbi:MAG TPA: response regulator [Fimbriimonadaceae bacterium]|nr:response regulator [Fimbriimonadaceae bacterium]
MSRILIIDDETNIRTMIRLALQHVGHEVDTASDGEEGLRKFGDGTEWDLVLVDQRMPGMSGIEVQRAMRKRSPRTKLIMITAFGTIDLAAESIQAGAMDFMRKPFTAETLRRAVQSALERPIVSLSENTASAFTPFTRTTINGFRFEPAPDGRTVETGDITCEFIVDLPDHTSTNVKVILPAYVSELVKAYTDMEEPPGGEGFWQGLCEEALANYLWQNAELPGEGFLRIEDLTSSIQRWLDSVLTVELSEHAR